MDKYFAYLDGLRDSGVTNMYGAAPYLQARFQELEDDLQKACEILKTWMERKQAG